VRDLGCQTECNGHRRSKKGVWMLSVFESMFLTFIYPECMNISNETRLSYSIPGPHITNDVLKIMGLKTLKVKAKQ